VLYQTKSTEETHGGEVHGEIKDIDDNLVAGTCVRGVQRDRVIVWRCGKGGAKQEKESPVSESLCVLKPSLRSG